MTTTTPPTHDERGSTTISTLIGAVLGGLVILGFATFAMNVNAAAAGSTEATYDGIRAMQVRDRLGAHLGTASLPIALTATTATIPSGAEVIRYEIADGDLIVRYGDSSTVDWNAVPRTVRLDGLEPTSGFSVDQHDLVTVFLDGPGDRDETVVEHVDAGVVWTG